MDSKYHFPNLTLAYCTIIECIAKSGKEVPSVSDPMSIGSDFGNKSRLTKEIIGFSFSIEDPRDRAIFIPNRKINLPFAIANCLWTLSGSDNLDFINFYNGRGSIFSDDNLTLHGAHGKRLFDVSGLNQITHIIERLKFDNFSRRTVATIYHPNDNQDISRDIPCPIAIQFLQRDGRLNAITFMRSQSVVMVLPYDVFAFTFLQEALAIELGLELGSYYHLSGSFHYYSDEDELATKILQQDCSCLIQPQQYDIPQMPSDTSPFEMIDLLIKLEHQLQDNLKSKKKSNLYKLSMPDIPLYWLQIYLILAIEIMRIYQYPYKEYLYCLPNYYLRFFQ